MDFVGTDTGLNEIAFDFQPFLRVYSDGRIERMVPSQSVPPSDGPQNCVRSKDVIISPETGVSVRIYLPKVNDPERKLPLVIYIHGGAFCLGSTSSPPFHSFISSLVEKANVMAVSIDYRLAPEHPLPAAYDDSWEAFQWVLSHANGRLHDPWLNGYADFGRVFLGGDSAGANIANDVAIRAGVTDLTSGVKILGLFLVHPYFGSKEVDKNYKFLCPSSSGCDDDPRLNPAIDPRLPRMPCTMVMFCLAENDFLRERGRAYYEALKSKWNGKLEIMETEGEGHGFHLFNPDSDKAHGLEVLVGLFLEVNLPFFFFLSSKK